MRQNFRKSATRRNQTFNVETGSGGTDENTQNVALFKAVIKSLVERLTQNTQNDLCMCMPTHREKNPNGDTSLQ